MTIIKPSNRKGNLLIVDDEEELRDILAEILKNYAGNILTAANGKEALQIFREVPIDAVVSDIDMPIMNGLSLLREIRAMGYNTPFVVVTGFAEKNNIIDSLRYGATDFIEKPFLNSTIKSVVSKVLEFGVSLQDAQSELDRIFLSSEMKVADALRLHNVRKAMLHMKLECDIYIKEKTHHEN